MTVIMAEGMQKSTRGWGLSAFVLKVIACVTMVIDHIGVLLLPGVTILRIIGRISFPIFAYFIAEGCRYTRNKVKRFGMIFGLAIMCEVVYYAVSRVVEGTVLMTFSCSILIIYALQAFKKACVGRRAVPILCAALCLTATVAVGILVSIYVPIDYGLPGILIPVALSLLDYREGEAPAVFQHVDNRLLRLLVVAVGLVFLWYFRGRVEVQIYALLAVPFLALYNGKPGPRVFKYWFYIFYPAHLVILWLIARWM